GQDVTAADPEGCDRNQVTMLHAVPLQILFLDMRCGDLQRISDPLGGIEPTPGMWRVRGRMRPSIQINRDIDRSQPLGMKRCDLAADRVHFFRDSQLRGASIDICESMRTALPLRQRLDGCGPRFGSGPGGVIHWYSQPVANIRVADAIFIAVWRPLAGKINLC